MFYYCAMEYDQQDFYKEGAKFFRIARIYAHIYLFIGPIVLLILAILAELL